MDPLPVVPLESCSAEGLVYHLQRAAQRHRGLLLFQPGAEQAAALLVLKQRPRRKYADYEVVAPHESPAAAAALHKLGRQFTKAAMQRVGEHPYLLHAHLDDLADWLHPTTGGGHATQSKILLSRSSVLGEHVDRGLFNLVLGTAADLEPIHVTIGGERVSVKALLPADPPPGLLGLLIPGYTLQCLDPTTPAVPHGVHVPGCDSTLERCTLVLQWRLHPGFAIGETTVGELLQQFTVSVRAGTGWDRQVDEEALVLLASYKPTIAGDTNFQLFIKTLTGKTHSVLAHPQWSVANLKWAVYHKEGAPVDTQRFIYAARHLDDHQTLEQCGLMCESTIQLLLRLTGD